MAQFDADILLRVVTTKVDQALNKLEGRLDRINQAVSNLDITPKGRLKDLQKEIDSVGNSFKRLGAITKGAGMAGALGAATAGANALGQALQNISGPNILSGITGPINALGDTIAQATGPVASLVNGLTSLAAAAPLTAGTIAAATVALTAFAPQIKRAATDAQIFGAAAKADRDALFGLNEAFELTAEGAKKLSQAFSAAGLKAALADATKEQQNLVAGSADFAKATRQVLDLEEQLTAELREQDRVVKSINQERLAGALKNIGTDQFKGTNQKLLPAFQERGLQELNTGYAEALRLTQQRTAELTTAANVERALTEETTRGVRFREKSAEAAQRLRDYTGNVLQSAQGIGRTYQASARVQMSWNVALGQMRDISTQIGKTKQASKKIDESSLNITYAQIEAQKQLAALEKQRLEGQKQQEKLAQANAKRLESVALGVGFPLLFGAGPGSVLGSLAGSFAGQGFGGQIFGGAIGQIVDDVVNSVAKLGQALNPLTGDIDAVTKAAGISGTSLEEYIKSLEESGDAAAAAAEAQRVMATLVGDDGVTALQDFGEATVRLGNAFDRAMSVMAAGVARLINSLPGFLQFTKNLEDTALLDRALASKDPAQAENLKRLEASRVGAGGVDIEKQQRAIQALVRTQRTLEAGGGGKEELAILDKQLDIEKQKLAIAKLNDDITNNAVFEAEKELILKEQALKIQEVNNKQLTDAARNKEYELIYAERLNKEAALLSRKQQALDKASTKSAGQRTRQVEQSLKEGERLGNQLELQLAKLSGATKLSQDLQQIRVQTAQTQERINKLLNAEQQNILTTMNLERERLRIRQAYIAAGAQEMQRRERGLQPLEDIINERKALELRKQYGEKDAALRIRARDLAKDNVELTERQIYLELKKNQVIERGLQAQEYQRQILEQTVNGVGQQMAGLFDTLIQGTNDWNQVLTSTLRSLSSLLLQAGFSVLGGDDGKGFFSILSGNFGGARASGGPVSSGSSYLVGEEGPELFTPGRSGMIHPNGSGGEVNSVVNVTINSDGSTSTDASQANALGRLVESTVVGVIQRERRPGGILSR